MANLIKIIENQIEQKEKTSNSYKSKPVFRPSYLGSPCLRKVFYSYLRVEKDFPDPLQLKKYATLGVQINDLLADFFRKSGNLIDYHNEKGEFSTNWNDPAKLDLEFPINDSDLNLKGKMDAILIINDKLYIGEFKTATVNSFKNLKGPKEEHLIQGITYLHCFSKALKEGKYDHIERLKGITEVSGIVFLYVNKDDLSMKQFLITDGSEIFEKIVNKIFYIKEASENQTLPPKTEDWCGSCAWRNKCLQNFLPMVES